MKKLLSSFLILSLSASVFALDFSLRLNPGLAIPIKEHYKPALNLTAQGDVQLFDWMSAGIEGSFLIESPEGSGSYVNFVYGGIGAGVSHNIFSRFYFGAGGAAGFYNFSFTDGTQRQAASDLYFRAYGEFGFRFTPTMTLSANAGFNSFLSTTGFGSLFTGGAKTLMAGPVVGVSLKIDLSTERSSKNSCYASVRQDSEIYPLFMQLYKTNPVANVILTNGESAEIKNVTVSFTAGKYTSSALQSEPVPIIRKMQSASVDLPVDFSSELLTFAENGMISGNLTIEYELLGKKKKSVQGISLSVSNRNSYIWGNTESLAAYISPDTPEVLKYAKYVAGVARNKLYTGMNRNIQFAATMFEALKASGIVYSGDKTSPYSSFHLGEEPDYIQYPLQTMDFSSGDIDEIGLLYASCLESVGIATAFIPMEDDFLILVDTKLKPSSAGSHFADPESLVITDETVYFALSMAAFEEGFSKSREKGASQIKKILASEDAGYEFIETHYAWENYPPAIFTGYGDVLEMPTQSAVEDLFKTAVGEYIKSDLSLVVERAKESGNPNKIGLAYVRSGQYDNAKNEFSKAASEGDISAMNNLGNIYMMEKNYSAAKKQYERVLAMDHENSVARKGLENISSVLDE